MIKSYIYRILKFALQDFYRNIWLSLVTITILILTLVSINSLVVFNYLTSTAVRVIEDKIDISVYYKPSTSKDDIEAMKKYVMGLPEVSAVEYVSADEALEIFKQNHKGEDLILQAVDELSDNPLGATLRIKARNVENYPAVLQAIDKPEYNQLIVSKDYENRSEMINKVSGWTKTGERVVIIFILIFIAISALIVFNTIRVAIYTHREEIGIEKLVGATNWFVNLPFLVESIVYSLISCLIVALAAYPMLRFIQPYLSRFFGAGQFDVIAYFQSNLFLIFGGQFVVIVLLNVLASFFATRRYLKV